MASTAASSRRYLGKNNVCVSERSAPVCSALKGCKARTLRLRSGTEKARLFECIGSPADLGGMECRKGLHFRKDYAFQTFPGATCTVAIAFRVSTMQRAQSASS